MEGPHKEEEPDAEVGRALVDLAHRYRTCALHDPMNNDDL